LVEANVSEKYTVSIFRAEVAMLGSGGIYIGLEEGDAEGVGPRRHLPTILHSTKTQKNSILTAVRTSNLPS
jgi:hypothetical protein